MGQDKYDYNRFGMTAKRVGQAVVDILSKDDHRDITAEEITESRQTEYRKGLEEAARVGHEEKKYSSPFYIVYLYNKEHWAVNVVRGKFCPRQTEPIPENMVTFFPYWGKDVWKVDYEKGKCEYLWTLPALETIKQILNHKELYDPALSEWTAKPLSEKTEYSNSSTN